MCSERTVSVGELVTCLNTQSTLLAEFARMEGGLRKEVEKADWPRVQEQVRALRQLAERIQVADRCCTRILSETATRVGLRNIQSVDDLMDRVAESERHRLVTVQRGLQGAFWEVKRTTLSLSAYFESISSTLGLVLDELVPNRKARLYSRDGRRKSWSDGSFVVDTEL